jgi:TRAP-type C4-dicarboxylate transport system permease small subunit
MFDHITEKLGHFAAIIAGGILVSMVGFILFEIILRNAFSASTYVLDEFVGYGVAIMTFLSFSIALRHGTFIRVNLLIGNMSPRIRGWSEIVFCLLGTGMFGFIGLFLARTVYRNFTRGVTSNSIAEVPLWMPQILMLLGVVLLILQFLALTVRYFQGHEISDAQKEL